MTATATASPTRDRLVEAAQQLLWERSYQAASVDDICTRAGAKKGSFYHFFGSKTELAIAAVEGSWAATKAGVFDPIFASGPAGLGQLQRLVEVVDQLQRQTRERTGAYLGCPFGSLGQEMGHQDESLRVVLDRVFDEHCDYIERAIRGAVERGEIRVADARQRAEEVFALFEGALLIAKVANDPDRVRRLTSSLFAAQREA